MMTFREYLTCSDKEFFSSNPADIRRAIECEVNCFGYDPAKTLEGLSTKQLHRALMLALSQAQYESSIQNWVDDRNRQSNEVFRAACSTRSFQKLYMNSYSSSVDANIVRFYHDVSKEVGAHLHRTNLQTYASFIVYVLGLESSSMKRFFQQFRGSEDRYYRFCMI